MLRKIIHDMLFVVVAAFMLFAAAAVMAGDPPVEMSCTLVTDCGYDCWADTPYSITFAGQTTNGGVTTWTYKLSLNFPGGQNQLVLLSPVCSPEIGVVVSTGGVVLPPGEGDPTTNFGVYNFQDNVVRIATANPYVYTFTTAVPTPLHNTSMQLKSGKTLYICRNIAGPDCPPFPNYVPTTVSVRQKIAEFDVCIEEVDANGCPTKISDCQGHFWQIVLMEDITLNPAEGKFLKWAQGDSDPRCPSVTLIVAGSTCVKKCYQSGYCYVGPTGCTP